MRKTAQSYNYQKLNYRLTKPAKSGFTLIELLVVIAILIILAVAAWIIINPLEISRQGRDARRINDLATINQAIQSAVSEATSSAAYPLCNGTAGSCGGDSLVGGSSARNNNGTGWVKVNLSAATLKMPTLPLDPTNQGIYHYLYQTDGTDWELDANALESQKYSPYAANDGGNNNTAYEVGTNLNLLP